MTTITSASNAATAYDAFCELRQRALLMHSDILRFSEERIDAAIEIESILRELEIDLHSDIPDVKEAHGQIKAARSRLNSLKIQVQSLQSALYGIVDEAMSKEEIWPFLDLSAFEDAGWMPSKAWDAQRS